MYVLERVSYAYLNIGSWSGHEQVEIWIKLGRMFRIADSSIIQPHTWNSLDILFVSHEFMH